MSGLSARPAATRPTCCAASTSPTAPSPPGAAPLGARGPVFGENLAWGTGVTAQWVVDRWLASPSHRAVLLRPGFRRVGIGIAFGAFAGHGSAAVVTADFAGR